MAADQARPIIIGHKGPHFRGLDIGFQLGFDDYAFAALNPKRRRHHYGETGREPGCCWCCPSQRRGSSGRSNRRR